MNLTMIVNPNAGKKQGMIQAQYAAEVLKNQGIGVVILESRKAGETRTLAENLDLQGVDGVLAVGGDGTLFEVINGLLMNHDSVPVPLGQIPVGTGNSFIKDLGVESVDDALQMITSGNTKGIDLGYFSCSDGAYYFINLLGTGFVSNVAYRAKKYKMWGSLSYVLAVLEELLFLRFTPIELEIDGKLINRNALFTEICNSRYTGGDMMMAPDAEIDDGLLDIILMNKTTRSRLLKLFPSIFKGTHISNKAIETYRGKKIILRSDRPLLLTPDGETFGTTPIEVTMHPSKLRMYC
jgi:YegS/Rv2252/BmrU family lipid kinase